MGAGCSYDGGNNVHFIRAVRVRRGVRLPQMCPVRRKKQYIVLETLKKRRKKKCLNDVSAICSSDPCGSPPGKKIK